MNKLGGVIIKKSIKEKTESFTFSNLLSSKKSKSCNNFHSFLRSIHFNYITNKIDIDSRHAKAISSFVRGANAIGDKPSSLLDNDGISEFINEIVFSPENENTLNYSIDKSEHNLISNYIELKKYSILESVIKNRL